MTRMLCRWVASRRLFDKEDTESDPLYFDISFGKGNKSGFAVNVLRASVVIVIAIDSRTIPRTFSPAILQFFTMFCLSSLEYLEGKVLPGIKAIQE